MKGVFLTKNASSYCSDDIPEILEYYRKRVHPVLQSSNLPKLCAASEKDFLWATAILSTHGGDLSFEQNGAVFGIFIEDIQQR